MVVTLVRAEFDDEDGLAKEVVDADKALIELELSDNSDNPIEESLRAMADRYETAES